MLKNRFGKGRQGIARRFTHLAMLLLALLPGVSLAADPYSDMRLALGDYASQDNINWIINLRESALIPTFAILFGLFILATVGHYFIYGPKDHRITNPENTVMWWSLFERVMHAIVAISFTILLLSGLMITFGQTLSTAKYGVYMRQAHELSGYVFAPFFIIMALKWIGEAIPKAYDMEWFKHLGGYMGYKGHLTSGKFNGGQKVWYWIMFLAGIVLVLTGFGQVFGIGGIKAARLYVALHLYASIPIILMFVVHTYMATAANRGAFSSMINGLVNKDSMKEHHSESSVFKKA